MHGGSSSVLGSKNKIFSFHWQQQPSSADKGSGKQRKAVPALTRVFTGISANGPRYACYLKERFHGVHTRRVLSESKTFDEPEHKCLFKRTF